jgi:hypothetical protein
MEPFDLRPWEFGRLTDWQLVKLYGKAAEKRAKAMNRGGHPPPDDSPVPGDPNLGVGPPTELEAFVNWWSDPRVNGGNRASAVEAFQRMFPDAGNT